MDALLSLLYGLFAGGMTRLWRIHGYHTLSTVRDFNQTTAA